MSDFSKDSETIAHQQKFSGYFENFANTEASPSVNSTGVKVMRCLNKVANRHQMQCQWAGSVQKKTYVDGYSDADIWVETNDCEVTSSFRSVFAELVMKELQLVGIQQIEGPDYKPTATSFYTQDCDFDIVFSKSDWTDPRRVIPPDSQDFRCKLNRQRAVKVLKILSKLYFSIQQNSTAFPDISGMRLERLVICCSKEIV